MQLSSCLPKEDDVSVLNFVTIRFEMINEIDNVKEFDVRTDTTLIDCKWKKNRYIIQKQYYIYIFALCDKNLKPSTQLQQKSILCYMSMSCKIPHAYCY